MELIIIKHVREPYEKDADIRKSFHYIAGECGSKEEHTRYCCGAGVSLKPKKAAGQMILVQKAYKKAIRESGKRANRRLYHYVVSFPPSIDDANCAKLAAMGIAGMFSGQYQVYYGVHEDSECLHIHFAINAVSYVDGKKWHKSRKELKEIEAQIRERAAMVVTTF